MGATSKMGQRDIRRLLITGAMAVVQHASRKRVPDGSWLGRMLARKPPENWCQPYDCRGSWSRARQSGGWPRSKPRCKSQPPACSRCAKRKAGVPPRAPALAFKAARSATAGSSARHARCGGRVRGTAGRWHAPGRHRW
ncbi:hypothetical protein CDV54_20150 [Paracoccus yeei]|nr:hypothetical protein CDV54_20150 [Paracoccus yeei]